LVGSLLPQTPGDRPQLKNESRNQLA
jgi:hypothetical protein